MHVLDRKVTGGDAVKTRTGSSNHHDAVYQTPIFHFSDHTYFLFVKLLWQVDLLNLASRLEVSRTLKLKDMLSHSH